MDKRIPKQWLLEQYMDLGARDPSDYPVFVKPALMEARRLIQFRKDKIC